MPPAPNVIKRSSDLLPTSAWTSVPSRWSVVFLSAEVESRQRKLETFLTIRFLGKPSITNKRGKLKPEEAIFRHRPGPRTKPKKKAAPKPKKKPTVKPVKLLCKPWVCKRDEVDGLEPSSKPVKPMMRHYKLWAVNPGLQKGFLTFQRQEAWDPIGKSQNGGKENQITNLDSNWMGRRTSLQN